MMALLAEGNVLVDLDISQKALRVYVCFHLISLFALNTCG